MKSKKQLVLAILASTVCAASSFALSACNDHVHNFGDWTQKSAPTCTQDGEEVRRCDGCDEEETRKVDALGHSFGEWKVEPDSTCTEAGTQYRECANCDEKETKPLDLKAHEWGSWTTLKEATCTEDGTLYRECAVCHEDEIQTDDAKGHSWGKWETVKEATCTEEGKRERECANCHEKESETIEANSQEHSWVLKQTIKEATCADGLGEYECEYCHETEERAIPAVAKHSYGEWDVTKEATCTEEGEKTRVCENCDDAQKEPIPATGHTYGEWTVTPATCTEDGKRERTCDDCDDVQSEPIPAAGHRYGDWKVTKPATCTEEGERTQTCVDCGDVHTEAIPATGHHYADWQITLPTIANKGEAVKLCEGDTEFDHVIRVELPAIGADFSGNDAYSDVLQGENGRYTFVLENENGEIRFDVYSEIDTVEKAVSVAVDTQRNVVTASAVDDATTVSEGTGSTNSKSEILFELGYNYAHIVDETMTEERFISLLEDGTLFPVLKTMVGGEQIKDEDGNTIGVTDPQELISKDTAATEECLNGFGYTLMFLMGGEKQYGTGSFINYLYQLGKLDTNKDFKEEVKEDEDGNKVYTFGFGYFNYVSPTTQYFHVVNVEFSLDDSFIVGEATVNCKTYVTWNTNGRDDPETGFMVFDHEYTYEEGENGTYSVIPEKSGRWACNETFKITQSAQLAEGQTLPTNPYNYEDMVISSYKLYFGGEQLFDGYNLSLEATEAIQIDLDDILPSTYNPYFDDITMVLVDKDGNEIDAVDGSSLSDGEIGFVFFRGNDGVSVDLDKYITFKSLLAGKWDLKITTAKTEMTIHLTVNEIAPSPLYAYIYQYNEDELKGEWSKTLTEVTVYEGQALTFDSYVDHPAYESKKFTYLVNGDADLTAECIKTVYEDGLPVLQFCAEEAGVYTVRLTSTIGAASVAFTVTVLEAPDLTEMLTGEYTYYSTRDRFVVTFTPDEENPLQGTAKISNGYKDAYETVITYLCNGEKGALVTEYLSGAKNDVELIDFNYGLEITNSYRLYLTVKSRFVDTETSRYALVGEEGIQNDILVTNEPITNLGNAKEWVANVPGMYRFTSNDQYTFYKVNDEAQLNKLTADIELYGGDVLKIWSLMPSSSGRYSIELIEAYEIIPVLGLEFEEDAYEVRLGGTLTVAPVFTPELTTQRKLEWVSSNTDIATVSATGVITGVKEGTATITATAFGGYEASFTVTVVDGLVLGDNTGLTLTAWSATSFEFNGVAGKTYVISVKESAIGIRLKGGSTYLYNDEYQNTVARLKVVAGDDGVISFELYTNGYGVAATVSIAEYIAVTGVTLDKTEATIEGVGSTKLSATVAPAKASVKDGFWSSSNEEVATVDFNGNVISVAPGTAVITYTSNDNPEAKASCTVTVENVVVDSVELNYTSYELIMGSSAAVQLTATVGPENAFDKTLTWTTSNEEVATVTGGRVVAVAVGTATITVTTASGLSATCEITVKVEPVTGVTLNYEQYELGLGSTFNLTATVAPANASNKVLTWTTSNPEVATVSAANGYTVERVTSVAVGTTTITVTSEDGGFTASCVVTVKVIEPTAIRLNRTTATVAYGRTTTLSVTWTPTNTTYKNVTWTSSDPEIATVSSTGVVTAVGKGTATITATTANGLTATCTVTATKTEVTGVTVSKTSLDLLKGETSNLTATYTPSSASDRTGVWTTSNPDVVTVTASSNTLTGTLTAVGVGTATITYTTNDGGFTATCEVTVTIPEPSTLNEGSNTVKVILNVDNLAKVVGKPNTYYDLVGGCYMYAASADGTYDEDSCIFGDDWKYHLTVVTDAEGVAWINLFSAYNASITITVTEG